jgi:hypothetical protein
MVEPERHLTLALVGPQNSSMGYVMPACSEAAHEPASECVRVPLAVSPGPVRLQPASPRSSTTKSLAVTQKHRGRTGPGPLPGTGSHPGTGAEMPHSSSGCQTGSTLSKVEAANLAQSCSAANASVHVG